MTQHTKNMVSIRLLSGGHSFSSRDTCGVTSREGVTIELCTHKTTLVPAAMLNASDASCHLRAVGLAPAIDETVVCSTEVNGVVAVMAISSECHDHVARQFVCGLSYSSPLLVAEPPVEGSVLSLYGDTLYVAVYKSGLRFAEAMEVKGDADILYYLESVNRVYDIYNMYARAKGDVSRLKGVCRSMFRSIVCE